jgi:pSer/pThr/pTyr-binding forkhead associated (FHA) protein
MPLNEVASHLRPAASAPFGRERDVPNVTAAAEPHNTLSPPAGEKRAEDYRVGANRSVPSLVVIGQDGSVGRTYTLTEVQTDIGRTEGDIVLPDDRFVCPRHARLLRNGATVVIQDLSSVNGVYRRVKSSVALLAGDTLLLGLAVLRFEVLTDGEQRINVAVERGTQVFGTPSGPRYARLTERTVEGVSRSVFVLTREETILGREVGDIVFSSDPFMSRRHAAITRNPNDGSFTLVDLGSSNGTFLRIRGHAELFPGDHLRVGQHLFRYDYEDGQSQGQAKAR